MRDAVGGVFMMEVFLVFLFVYVIFIGVAINYARAFRVKNKIIDIIEQNEGVDLGSDNELKDEGDSTITEINDYLDKIHYKVVIPDDAFDDRGACHSDYGYCIQDTTNTSDQGPKYYKVTTFVRITIPFLDPILSYTIPITGETRKVERIGS